MYDMSEVAKRIKLQAKQKNCRLKDLLSSCGLGINAVSQLSSVTTISAVSLAKIADYLDCSMDYLMCRTDNPHINQNDDRISVEGTQEIERLIEKKIQEYVQEHGTIE